MADVGVPDAEGAELAPEDLEFIEVEFPAAKASAEALVRKKVYTPQKFRELSDEARANAFTVSAQITQHSRETIRDRLGEMIEEGADRQQFMEEFKTLPLSEAHLEQVFRNNVRSAFSEGMEDVLDEPAVGEAFVYRLYNAIDDDRVRKNHLALETLGIQGTNVYHKDDPVWKTFRPPWSWLCRCDWTAISIRQAAQLGIKSAQTALANETTPEPDFVKMPPFQPPPLWRRPL